MRACALLQGPLLQLYVCMYLYALVAAQADFSLFYYKAEEDIPVPKREYDDLNLRYSQLQEDYVNLQQEFDTLRAENVKLKEELQQSTFSYTNVTVSATLNNCFFSQDSPLWSLSG